jgi:hypothetical protein
MSLSRHGPRVLDIRVAVLLSVSIGSRIRSLSGTFSRRGFYPSAVPVVSARRDNVLFGTGISDLQRDRPGIETLGKTKR